MPYKRSEQPCRYSDQRRCGVYCRKLQVGVLLSECWRQGCYKRPVGRMRAIMDLAEIAGMLDEDDGTPGLAVASERRRV